MRVLCLANQYLTVLLVHTVYSYAKAFDSRQCLDMQHWTEIKRKPDKYWQGRGCYPDFTQPS